MSGRDPGGITALHIVQKVSIMKILYRRVCQVICSKRAFMFGAYGLPSKEAHRERKLSDAGQTQWRMRLDIIRRYLTGSLHDNKHASTYTRRPQNIKNFGSENSQLLGKPSGARMHLDINRGCQRLPHETCLMMMQRSSHHASFRCDKSLAEISNIK